MKISALFVRVVAAIMDSLLVCLFWYYFIAIWGHPKIEGLNSATVGSGKVVTGGPAIVLLFLTAVYWMIPEWIFGATLGKVTLGLRVRTLADHPISFGQSFKRNLLRLVDFFPFYLTGFLVARLTPKHQRLGDLWAQTVVVRKKVAVLSQKGTLA